MHMRFACKFIVGDKAYILREFVWSGRILYAVAPSKEQALLAFQAYYEQAFIAMAFSYGEVVTVQPVLIPECFSSKMGELSLSDKFR